jgi:hypothetical protein
LIPIHYIGWTIIFLAILRFCNKATINVRWKFAFSMFTTLYSLGKLASIYASTTIADLLYLCSAATVMIPFLRIKYDLYTDIDRISETSLFLSIGIIVLLS